MEIHQRHTGKQEDKPFDLYALVQPTPKDAVMRHQDYFIWCTSVVEGLDGKFHMLYSRWPRAAGFGAWVSDSEVAYAVADHPLGPFIFQNVALPRRGMEYWDGLCTHNPTVMRIGHKYYLYYMGITNDMGTTKKAMDEQLESALNQAWWGLRNNQRIGVAVADHPSGPWERMDHPLIDVSADENAFDSLLTSNPAAAVRPDGGMLFVYKAVTKGPTLRGGVVRYGIAMSDHPLGPVVKQPGTIFEADEPGENQEHWMVAEDPYIWHSGERYYAVCRDVSGLFTGDEGGICLFESTDGLKWHAATHPKVLGSQFQWDDGSSSVSKLERPQLLIREGKPIVLYGALGIEAAEMKRWHSCGVFIPLNNQYNLRI